MTRRAAMSDDNLLRLGVIALCALNWAVMTPLLGARDPYSLATFGPLALSALVLPLWLRTAPDARGRKLALFGAIAGLTIVLDAALLAWPR